MTVRLTFIARDAAHAARIAAAVATVDAGPSEPELLVQPDGAGAPTGHTYRELCDARRAGLLDAAMTSKGLVFTATALETYRRAKGERRRRARQPKPAEVTDLTEHRIKALESAGFVAPRGRR